MSIETRKHQYGKIFDHWQIRDLLGEGSNGKSAVFRLQHSDTPDIESALKVVGLIEEKGKLTDLSPARRHDYEQAREKRYRDAEKEVMLMDSLRGNTNIVDYMDHSFADWQDETGFGRDMLIRMELLRDLRGEMVRGRRFDEAEIRRLGVQICTALSLCHKKGILHRDIKPENIFLNRDDVARVVFIGPRRMDYKLRALLAGIDESRIVCVEDEMDAPEKLDYTPGEDIYLLYGTDSLTQAFRLYDKLKSTAQAHGEKQEGAR